MRIPALLPMIFGLLWMGGCSSNPPDIDPAKEKLIDKLTLFVEAVQTEKFDQAFSYVTPEEKAKMVGPGGVVTPHVARQLKALRLSTLAQKPSVHLVYGKLEGISEALPMLNDPPEGPRQPAADVPLLQ